MAKHIIVNGYNELKNHLNQAENNLVYILFTGNKDENGESWCGDCRLADPILEECLKSLNPNSEFITCYVGERPYWKNLENEFRTDPEFKVRSIPTLVQWKTNKALVEQQCADKSLVEMLFQDSE